MDFHAVPEIFTFVNVGIVHGSREACLRNRKIHGASDQLNLFLGVSGNNLYLGKAFNRNSVRTSVAPSGVELWVYRIAVADVDFGFFKQLTYSHIVCAVSRIGFSAVQNRYLYRLAFA